MGIRYILKELPDKKIAMAKGGFVGFDKLDFFSVNKRFPVNIDTGTQIYVCTVRHTEAFQKVICPVRCVIPTADYRPESPI